MDTPRSSAISFWVLCRFLRMDTNSWDSNGASCPHHPLDQPAPERCLAMSKHRRECFRCGHARFIHGNMPSISALGPWMWFPISGTTGAEDGHFLENVPGSVFHIFRKIYKTLDYKYYKVALFVKNGSRLERRLPFKMPIRLPSRWLRTHVGCHPERRFRRTSQYLMAAAQARLDGIRA